MNYSFKHNENAAGAAPGILDRVFSFFVRRKSETLYQRFLRYLEEAHRDGVMGGGRYAVALGKAHKLQRFLTIIGQPSISAHKFTTDMVLRFRHFIYDEYKYASQYPALYPCGAGHRVPNRQLKSTTVVHDLKLLQAFFAELETTEEIRRSPFRSISMEKRRFIMHVSYDEPIYLRKDELKIIMATVVPEHLQWVKDLFVLNCAIGCRISDLLRLTTNNVSTSDDGIPYIHYIPSKTAKLQASNREVTTPLIAPAVDIIDRTGLRLMPYRQHYGKQRYNKALRQLLQYCGITRKVKIYSLDAMANIEKPICDIATSKLARKTHIDMLNKVQINFYVAGLHRPGSDAVYRYTSLELRDRYELLKAAFD